MTLGKWFTTHGSAPKTGCSTFVKKIKKKATFQHKINYKGHSTPAPDFLSRPKMTVSSLNLVYKQLHALCIGTSVLRSQFRHLEIATGFSLVSSRPLGVLERKLHLSFAGPNRRKSDATKSTMRGGWGITFRDSFASPMISSTRYILSRTWKTAAWSITLVGVRAISDVLPSVIPSHRQCGLRTVY